MAEGTPVDSTWPHKRGCPPAAGRCSGRGLPHGYDALTPLAFRALWGGV